MTSQTYHQPAGLEVALCQLTYFGLSLWVELQKFYLWWVASSSKSARVKTAGIEAVTSPTKDFSTWPWSVNVIAICWALLLTPGGLQYTILHIFTLYRLYYLSISQQPLVLPPLVHLHAKQPSNASLILELALPGTQVDFWLLRSLTDECFWCVKFTFISGCVSKAAWHN